MRLIPLYDFKALVNTWGYYIEGLDAVLEYTTGDTTLPKIFNLIMAKKLLLWIAFEDKKYIGFFTTCIDETPFGERTLLIKHLYIKKGVSKKTFFDGMKEVKDFAKKMDCSQIKFYTIRDKGFEHKLRNVGWKQGYLEFMYNLTNGELIEPKE